MREVGRLAHRYWHGQWQNLSFGEEKKDGYRNYTGTIPLLATTQPLLAAKGPQGPVWWRYGHERPAGMAGRAASGVASRATMVTGC